MRRHDRALAQAAETLRVPPERVADAVAELRGRVRELERAARQGGAQAGSTSSSSPRERSSATAPGCSSRRSRRPTARRCSTSPTGSRTSSATPRSCSAAPARTASTWSRASRRRWSSAGVRAGEIVKVAAAEVGGGGGGRDTLARAGGRDVEKLPEAIEAARAAIERAVAG